MDTPHPVVPPPPASGNDRFAEFSPKWQFRFNFFEQRGTPGTPGYREGFKALSFGQRIKLGMNVWAFFFTWLFFLCTGMWRKALSLIGIWLLLLLVAMLLPEVFGRAIGIAWSAIVASTANYAYYLHHIKGSISWNPFEGMRWR